MNLNMVKAGESMNGKTSIKENENCQMDDGLGVFLLIFLLERKKVAEQRGWKKNGREKEKVILSDDYL